MNGHDSMALGVMLGGLQAESRRQTEIMLATLDETREMRDDLRDLPERIAARIPASRGRTSGTIEKIVKRWAPVWAPAAALAATGQHQAALDALKVALGH